MTSLVYVTHPQVTIDPAIPVPEWSLNALGRQRVVAACRQPWLQDVQRIVSSTERKAIETAEILAADRGLTVEICEGLHENDRSATGYLPAAEFEAVADQFFAAPEKSVRGWERAADAQARIVAGWERIAANQGGKNSICLVGHGGVGTLLYCALAGLPINRCYDQPGGGGHYFVFDSGSRRMLHGWRPIDRTEPA